MSSGVVIIFRFSPKNNRDRPLSPVTLEGESRMRSTFSGSCGSNLTPGATSSVLFVPSPFRRDAVTEQLLKSRYPLLCFVQQRIRCQMFMRIRCLCHLLHPRVSRIRPFIRLALCASLAAEVSRPRFVVKVVRKTQVHHSLQE